MIITLMKCMRWAGWSLWEGMLIKGGNTADSVEVCSDHGALMRFLTKMPEYCI